MIIAVDARALRRPMAGIGRYQFWLGTHLTKQLPEAQFIAVGCRALDIDLPPGWSTAWDDHPGWDCLPRLAWLRWRSGPFSRSLGADIFWGGSLQIPRPVPGLRRVLTAYDLVHRIAPTTLAWKGRIALQAFLKSDLQSADAVVAISQGTADRVRQWMGRNVDAVVRPAVDGRFRPQPPQDVQQWRQRRGLPWPYVLALGTHEPRKNLALLAKAWLKARNQLGNLHLVLAGRSGWRHADTDKLLKQLGPACHTLGYLPDEELPLALAGAEALAFPSQYEGFGMPIAESLAVGTPVLAADSMEMREASQGTHHCVDLTPDAWSVCLMDIAQGRVPKSKAQLLPWTWDDGANAMAEIFRNATRNGP